MKLFVTALLTLALIAGLCIWGTAASTSIIDDLLSELHRVPADDGNVPKNASEVSENILAMWEEKMFVISMFLPHEHLDEVKEKMIALQSYADAEEYAEWAEAHNNLEEALLHLRDLLAANIDNIM